MSVFIIIDLPSAVHLHFGESVFTPLESTTVNCTAVGRSDAYNLTLWKNNRLLASNSGNSLIYSTQPSQYGTYRCAVDSVHNTSLLREEGNVLGSYPFFSGKLAWNAHTMHNTRRKYPVNLYYIPKICFV